MRMGNLLTFRKNSNEKYEKLQKEVEKFNEKIPNAHIRLEYDKIVVIVNNPNDWIKKTHLDLCIEFDVKLVRVETRTNIEHNIQLQAIYFYYIPSEDTSFENKLSWNEVKL